MSWFFCRAGGGVQDFEGGAANQSRSSSEPDILPSSPGQFDDVADFFVPRPLPRYRTAACGAFQEFAKKQSRVSSGKTLNRHAYAPDYLDRHHKSSRAGDKPLRCFLDLPSGEMLDLC